MPYPFVVYDNDLLTKLNTLSFSSFSPTELETHLLNAERRLARLQKKQGALAQEIIDLQEHIDFLEFKESCDSRAEDAHYIYQHQPYNVDLWSILFKPNLPDARSKKLTLVNNNNELLNAIEQEQAEVNKLTAELAFLHQMNAAKKYLADLNERPGNLVAELYTKLQQSILAYEAKHVSGHSIQVRLALYHYHASIRKIINEGCGENVKYLTLIGLVNAMYDQLAEEDKQNPFGQCLAEVASTIHVAEDETLNTMASAWWWYDTLDSAGQLRVTERYLSFLNKDTLLQQEIKLFEELANGLYHRTPKDHFQQAAEVLLLEVKKKKAANEEVDYYFYARIVRNLTDLSNNPLDTVATEDLYNLLSSVSGTPVFSNQVQGALVTVLGALLILSATALFMAAMASCPPLVGVGMVLGLSLLQLKIAAGAVAVVGATAGYGLAFWGRHTFYEHSAQGVYQRLASVHGELKGEPESEPDLSSTSPQ